ncbi:hypothetical protein ACOSQ4_029062 [Xanthoceras sorbifolium]
MELILRSVYLWGDKPRYRIRKGEITTNVLDFCSRDLEFIFVLPGWEDSTFDSRVLRDAITRPNELKVPSEMMEDIDNDECDDVNKDTSPI